MKSLCCRFHKTLGAPLVYVGMLFPSVEETAKRLATQRDDKIILNIGAFDSNTWP